jgi:hypothetical protein
VHDGQQPFVKREPLSTYPATPLARDRDSNFLVTGQVHGESAPSLAAGGSAGKCFSPSIRDGGFCFKLFYASNIIIDVA